MVDTLLRLTPILAGIAAGFILRRLGLTDRRDGEFLFRLIFYVCAPALMFSSLATAPLTFELLALPLVSLLMAVTGFVSGRFAAKRLHFTPAQVPVFVIMCMIVNTGFSLPFVQAVYGSDGVAALATFDLVNATLTFTWMYAIAARGNPDHRGEPVLLRKLYTSPPVYGIGAGLLVNLMDMTMPAVVSSTASAFGSPTSFLITLAIGTVFTPGAFHLHGSVAALGVRLAGASLVAFAAIVLLDLDGLTRGVVLLLAVAPVGFNAVTFASLENLDVEFATSTLSLSLIVSLVLASVVTIALA